MGKTRAPGAACGGRAGAPELALGRVRNRSVRNPLRFGFKGLAGFRSRGQGSKKRANGSDGSGPAAGMTLLKRLDPSSIPIAPI
jgi:hypothetical protein